MPGFSLDRRLPDRDLLRELEDYPKESIGDLRDDVATAEQTDISVIEEDGYGEETLSLRVTSDQPLAEHHAGSQIIVMGRTAYISIATSEVFKRPRLVRN